VQRKKGLIVADGWPILLVLGVLLIATVSWGGWKAGLIPLLLVLFTLFFFRNPPRKISAADDEVVSPADGVVLAVEEVQEENYMHSHAIKVSIFLNVFNVHVNRTPITGVVDFLHYRPGRFLPAFKSHASELNERNYVGIRSMKDPGLMVLVVQITGFIARRIACWVKEGDALKQGELFGMIKFGSCTEIYLPKTTEVYVKKGEKVKGGVSIIGRLHNE
jgi:phosphatidylserine decarboxylase